MAGVAVPARESRRCADYCDLIYFKDRDDLCVNLFAALHGEMVARRRERHIAPDDAVS